MADEMNTTDVGIAGDFDSLSPAEQEQQREEWKSELEKIESEIRTLWQVLSSKEEAAVGLKRRLGITAWQVFSDDMQQGIKQIQDTSAFKKTAEGISAVKTKTVSALTSLASSNSFLNMTDRVGSALGAAKNKFSSGLEKNGPGCDYTILSPSRDR